MKSTPYPPVLDSDLVGFFDTAVGSGGGYVWAAVLEYRVWLRPELGAPDESDGSDYFHAFENYADAPGILRCLFGSGRADCLDTAA